MNLFLLIMLFLINITGITHTMGLQGVRETLQQKCSVLIASDHKPGGLMEQVMKLSDSVRALPLSEFANSALQCNGEIGRKLCMEKKPSSYSINSAIWSPDGSCIASCDWTGTVSIFSSLTDEEPRLLTCDYGTSRNVFGKKLLKFSHDGTVLLSGLLDGTVCVWDVKTKALKFKLSGYAGIIDFAEFGPDSSYIVTAGKNDFIMRFWDVCTGQRVGEYMHQANVSALQLSPDKTKVALCAGSVVYIRDLVTRECFMRNLPQKVVEQYCPIGAVACNSSASKIAIAAQGYLDVCDCRSNDLSFRRFLIGTCNVDKINFNIDDTKIEIYGRQIDADHDCVWILDAGDEMHCEDVVDEGGVGLFGATHSRTWLSHGGSALFVHKDYVDDFCQMQKSVPQAVIYAAAKAWNSNKLYCETQENRPLYRALLKIVPFYKMKHLFATECNNSESQSVSSSSRHKRSTRESDSKSDDRNKMQRVT